MFGQMFCFLKRIENYRAPKGTSSRKMCFWGGDHLVLVGNYTVGFWYSQMLIRAVILCDFLLSL